MNYKIIFAFLGFVSLFLGVCMFACIPWGLEAFGGGPSEAHGIRGLYLSALVCFVAGISFSALGRRADANRLYLREAFACVALSWFLSIILGALPYLLSNVERVSGVPFTFGDAIFESASGITTTGGTVFEDLENPETLPRCILFWRSMTHFLGGLGVMCCFVVLLGKGARGKTVLRVEHQLSENLPFAKMKSLAISLFIIYVSIQIACFIWFLICGMNIYDAISHAFSVVATGGFGTYNDSLGHFKHVPGFHQTLMEYGTIFFMIIAGTNFWLLLWASRGSFGKLFHDVEWQSYILILFFAGLLTTCLGLLHGEYVIVGSPAAETLMLEAPDSDVLIITTEDVGFPATVPFNTEESFASNSSTPVLTTESEPESELEAPSIDSSACHGCAILCDSFLDAFKKSLFHTTSLMTSSGFATECYECGNAPTLLLLMCLMFIGGCSGSTAGGVKIFRALLAFNLLRNEKERKYRPNVVRVPKLGGIDVDADTAHSALKHIAYFAMLIIATTLVVSIIEPDTEWMVHHRPNYEKLFDLFGGTLAMFSNAGLGFGNFGSTGNYSHLSEFTKIIYSWAMIVGRLEIWCVLAIFSRGFWHNR